MSKLQKKSEKTICSSLVKMSKKLTTAGTRCTKERETTFHQYLRMCSTLSEVVSLETAEIHLKECLKV